MNYYPFHIGDYVSATRHLSWEEDAAYRRLLDTYYTTEKPLPAELRAVCRLVMATTENQREAVKIVLEEFFEATADGWINRRADAEINAMRDKQQKQREKANRRWDKQRAAHGTASAVPQHQESDAAASKGDTDAMPPTPTPTPTVNHSEAKASGGEPPKVTDPDEIIFGYGVPLLTSAGSTDKHARSFLGGLRKQHGDAALIDKLRDCIKAKPLQPIEWLAAALPPKARASPGRMPAAESFASKDYGTGGLI